jgi:actin-related protein 10
MGMRIKEAICRVLFTYFQVPSVTFLSSGVLALTSAGLRTGLVVDIGWHETRVLPVQVALVWADEVFELRPLNPFVQVSPIACQRLHNRLRYLLQEYSSPKLISPSVDLIDDFLVRGLYTPPDPPTYPPTISTGLIPNDQLSQVYSSPETITYFVPSLKTHVTLPNWIRSRTTELFFEGDRADIIPDTDEIGLIGTITSCLGRLPSDVRGPLLQNIIFVGGGAAIPGVRTRITGGLQRIWRDKTGRSTTPPGNPGELTLEDLSAMKTVRAVRANALEGTLIGASLLGDVKVKGLCEVTREGFNSSGGRNVMDWTFVGGGGEESVEESKRRSRA